MRKLDSLCPKTLPAPFTPPTPPGLLLPGYDLLHCLLAEGGGTSFGLLLCVTPSPISGPLNSNSSQLRPPVHQDRPSEGLDVHLFHYLSIFLEVITQARVQTGKWIEFTQAKLGYPVKLLSQVLRIKCSSKQSNFIDCP